LQYITAEKEKQLKEVMKIMGLSNWLHWTAWFVKSFIMLTISAILIAVLVKINWTEGVAVLTHASFTALVFFLIIYIIASICFCLIEDQTKQHNIQRLTDLTGHLTKND